MNPTLTIFGQNIQIFIALFFIILLFAEFFFPLRKTTESKTRRVARNLAIGGISGLVMRLLFLPVIFMVSANTSAGRWGGALAGAPLPKILFTILLISGMDYTLYVWHRLNHRLPFLWRFHNVHHVDLDLDASTAFRFHFGELSLSAGFRVLQVLVLGIDPFTLAIYESLNLVFTQFHHSNVRLPARFERVLRFVFVTPRMHGIHHSVVRNETDSNYSTIFSWWDRAHLSFRDDIPQAEITIGVPGYATVPEIQFWRLIVMPLSPLRPWQYPDGSVPIRYPPSAAILAPPAKLILRIFGVIQFFFPDVPIAEPLVLASRLVADAQPKPVLVDVRSDLERNVSIIQGAISVDEFERAKLPSGTRVVTYCTIGGRSAIFARRLRRRGFRAENLRGSILLWAHLGLPVVNGDKPTKTIHTFSKLWAILPVGWNAVWNKYE